MRCASEQVQRALAAIDDAASTDLCKNFTTDAFGVKRASGVQTI